MVDMDWEVCMEVGAMEVLEDCGRDQQTLSLRQRPDLVMVFMADMDLEACMEDMD